MPKRMVSLLLLLLFAVSLVGIPSFAAEDDRTLDLPTRGQVCYMCNFGTLRKTVTYGPWRTLNATHCVHYTFGDDAHQRRTITTVFSCNNCDYSYEAISYGYQLICHGYNF